jgi:hypothetical protein
MSRLDDARDLFAELNYAPAHDVLPRRDWGEAARTALAEDPQVIAAHGDFQVIYCRLAHARLPRTDERQVVNRLLQQHPYALFLFSNSAQSDWHFLNVKYDQEVERRRLFRRIAVGRDERLRTATERISKLDLEKIQRDLRHIPPLTIQKTHDDAFDVEAVTREFYKKYHAVFQVVERRIEGIREPDGRRLFTQRLFNRLMFLAFVQKKGWLTYDGRTDYLDALWASRGRVGPKENFYNDRLKPLFFMGLNTPRADKGAATKALVGDVPYLNGGLFEQEDEDRDPGIIVPDSCINAILDGLFAPFNFTVTESTPLDVEVAVDPEMLGKVFEELVTGRHETGSYYTPKPVVSFMCREALKGYLKTALPGESPDAIEPFVEDHDPERLKYPEAVLEALRRVRTCDPACGSGAYLLGMLHELLDLRTCLFAARNLDPLTTYERKLEIIENNVYGVDIDLFAVNIARLRLWLSLAVDFEGEDPPPLPNLDMKIETGDSLAAPNPQGMGQRVLRHDLIRKLRDTKAEYMRAHGGKKQRLREAIAKHKADIAAWTHAHGPVNGFDWQVEYAEVFADQGFDIVLANPPYVRMELIKPLKPMLRANFPYVHDERTDLYVYFFARAHELLRPNAFGCFISSNKWLRAGYGEKLRQHLLDAQAFRIVLDFGDQPVFQATSYPCIFLWQKQARGGAPTTWAVIQDLQACYDEGLLQHVARIGQSIPASQFGKGRARLAAPESADLRSRMEASGPRLGEVVKGQILRGVVTGLNDAFVIDRATRDRLVAGDPKSSEVIKPLLAGDDVRRYEIQFRDSYLLYMAHGIDIHRYPAIEVHLKPFRSRLEARATRQEWYELQQPQAAYVPFFDQAKMVYPQIGREARFAFDGRKYYPLKTVYFLPSGDWYLLGLLNSGPMAVYMVETLTRLRGGYSEFYAALVENLPIPDGPPPERAAVGKLAQEVHGLHAQRWERVQRFLRGIGMKPAESSGRNPLEEPWKMTGEHFARRVGGLSQRVFAQARDETAALTERTLKIEREIDERVAALYGVALPEKSTP